jgi:hypothetical protein
MSVPGFILDPSGETVGASVDTGSADPFGSSTLPVDGSLAGSGGASSSGSDFWGSLSNSVGSALGQIAGTGLSVGAQLADYGITSLGTQAAKGIGQSAGNVPPQFVPYPVPAPSSAMSSSTLLIILAVAGFGVMMMMKGK